MYRFFEIWYSPFGIATRYGLDGPGIESRWGVRISATVQTGPGVHPASYAMVTGSFPVVKLPGRGVDHPYPSNTKVKERVELYLYFPSGCSWPILRWPLPLPSLTSYRKKWGNALFQRYVKCNVNRHITVNIERLLPWKFRLLRSMDAAVDRYRLAQLSAPTIMSWFSNYLHLSALTGPSSACADVQSNGWAIVISNTRNCVDIVNVWFTGGECSQNNWGVIILYSYCSVQLPSLMMDQWGPKQVGVLENWLKCVHLCGLICNNYITMLAYLLT